MDHSVPVFAPVGGGHTAAQRLGHELHAVADTQDRQLALPDEGLRARRARRVGARRPTGEHQGPRIEGAHRLLVGVVGHEFRVDSALADAAHDQRAVLGAKVEHHHALAGLGGRRRWIPRPRRGRAFAGMTEGGRFAGVTE